MVQKSQKIERRSCLTCMGRGLVSAGYGAVCTETIEKVEKCPDCKGKGWMKQTN